MVALELTVALGLLAQAPAAPVTITFRPPRVGEIQVLRSRQERVTGRCGQCPKLGPRGALCRKVFRQSDSSAVDRRFRIDSLRAGQMGSYQVTYERWDRSHRTCEGALATETSALKGLTFLVTTTLSRPLVTDPRGSPLNVRQESELVQEHLAFMDLRDLHPTQPRLVVRSGARVPWLEKAMVPLMRRLWLPIPDGWTLTVRFTGTETRQGRSVALFSIQVDASRRPSVDLRLAFEGCLALDVQTGRLQSLTGKLVPRFHGRALSDSGPRITTSLTAEYP